MDPFNALKQFKNSVLQSVHVLENKRKRGGSKKSRSKSKSKSRSRSRSKRRCKSVRR